MYNLFWIATVIVLYAYLGYPLLLFILNLILDFFKREKLVETYPYEPEITLFVAAYNEIDYINKKVKNSFSLDYPQEKINYLWITDGSTDGTYEALEKYTKINAQHNPNRNGKIGAINRGMAFVKTPIVIFSDANTIVNIEAIRELIKEFNDPEVGCVAGEKRILPQKKDNAVNSGEGIYWNYESFLKTNESKLNSTVGAVGELFAIRTDLFDPVENDTILDDFIISLRIAQKGYKIKYAPLAIATERASINISEELKRKTRIAYGGFQAISRLKGLLNPFKYPFFSFQYFSHKILRWFFVPFAIVILFITNFYLAIDRNWTGPYNILFYMQLLFYFLVLLGYIFQSKKIKPKILFIPYYIFIMNLSELIGLVRFLQKNQSVNWERSKRE